MNKPLLIGGTVLVGYFLFYKGKKVAPLSKGEAILRDPSQLEGGYFSTGEVPNGPCCRNCVNGRPCAS